MEAGPKGSCRVLKSDIVTLFEAIKRYGGRRDWTPSDENLMELPGPVLRYIIGQRKEIGRLERLLIRLQGDVLKMEKLAAQIRKPPR